MAALPTDQRAAKRISGSSSAPTISSIGSYSRYSRGRKPFACAGFDARPSARNRAPRFHLQYFTRASDSIGLAQSINRDSAERRSFGLGSGSAFSKPHCDGSRRVNSDDAGITRSLTYRVGTSGIKPGFDFSEEIID